MSVAMRCSTRWPVMLSNMQFVAIGNAFGLEVNAGSEDPFNPDNINVGWEEREGDTIAPLYKQAFDSYTGDECVITAVHGGLECADFASWSDELEIISVGPTIENPHSVSEYVEIDTVTKTCGRRRDAHWLHRQRRDRRRITRLFCAKRGRGDNPLPRLF